MKRPSSAASAAKSATERAKKPAKKPAKKAAQKRVARRGTFGAAWLKLVPNENEPLPLPKTKSLWNPDHPGVHHAGNIGESCSASGADDFVNLNADLEFGTFQMPSVTKGGKKTTKKKLGSRTLGRRRGLFEYRSGNPGKEIHQRWARVKAMFVNSALAKLHRFMAVSPKNLDTRCRYPESNRLGLILQDLKQECNEYRAVAGEIEEQLLDFMESEADDFNDWNDRVGNRRNLKNPYQAVVVEACNEKRNGHVWGEENPKADMELLKKKRQKARARPAERRKIEAQMDYLKRQWQEDSEDERPHNDSQIHRHDAMIIYFAGAKADPKNKMSRAKACARVALSKRIYRKIFILDPWTGEQYEV